MSVIVQTQELTMRFGAVKALDSVSIMCNEGVTAILGPNGAGKTTLIRVLLGLLPPSSGSAQLLGQDCQRYAERIHEKVGVLHEHPFFPQHFTAEQLLHLICRIYRISDSTHRIKDILQRVGLWDHRDRRIGHFSAGMNQRLGLSQALVMEPKLVILDEPMANLDPLSRLHTLEIIQEAWTQHRISFLILSHDLYYLEQICTDAIFLQGGQVRLSGRLDDLLGQQNRIEVVVVLDELNDATFKEISDLPSVETVERTNGVTINCRVKDARIFQNELFNLILPQKNLIRSFIIQREDLERLYQRVIGGNEDGIQRTGALNSVE